MADWQVTIVLIPFQWAERNEFKTDQLYDENGYEPTCAWVEEQPIAGFEKTFDAILPRAEPWSKDLTLWGDSKTNDISVWRKKTVITSIDFRLDLRENRISIMNALVASAVSLKCALFFPGQRVVIRPNIFELKKHILQSSAAEYVRDPKAFYKDTLPDE